MLWPPSDPEDWDEWVETMFNPVWRSLFIPGTRLRSLIKALTYRAAGSAVSFGIALFVTGNLSASAAIGGLDFVGKFIFFYLHERVWARVR